MLAHGPNISMLRPTLRAAALKTIEDRP